MNKSKFIPLLVALLIPVVAYASGALELQTDNSGATALTVKYSGATYPLFQVNSAGQHEWGSGAASADTNLYRSAADTLKTDDALIGDGGDALYGFKQNVVTATTTAPTIAQCGSTFVAAGAVVTPLPEASTVIGCRYTFIANTASDFDVNPADATDQFGPASIDGAAIDGAAGDAYRLTDVGTTITIQAVADDLWLVVSSNGPITDVN